MTLYCCLLLPFIIDTCKYLIYTSLHKDFYVKKKEKKKSLLKSYRLKVIELINLCLCAPASVHFGILKISPISHLSRDQVLGGSMNNDVFCHPAESRAA